MTLERGQRRQNPEEFVSRDVALRDAVLDTVEGLGPKSANGRAATDFVTNEVARRRSEATNTLKASEKDLANSETTERSLGDVLRSFAGKGTPASESLDKLIVERSLAPMDKTRRADYAAIPRDVPVPAAPFGARVQAIRQSTEHLPQNARSEVLPRERLQDFESMAGKGVAAESVPFSTINDMRPILSSDIARARAAGAPPSYVQNLEKLRSEINAATEAVHEATQRAPTSSHDTKEL